MSVTISDVPPMLRDLDFCLGQLRHAYAHLMAGRATNQVEFGRGLIAPEIRRLELIRAQLAASGMEARQGGNEVPSRSDDSPAPQGDAHTEGDR
jgi:hypothetical protein